MKVGEKVESLKTKNFKRLKKTSGAEVGKRKIS